MVWDARKLWGPCYWKLFRSFFSRISKVFESLNLRICRLGNLVCYFFTFFVWFAEGIRIEDGFVFLRFMNSNRFVILVFTTSTKDIHWGHFLLAVILLVLVDKDIQIWRVFNFLRGFKRLEEGASRASFSGWIFYGNRSRWSELCLEELWSWLATLDLSQDPSCFLLTRTLELQRLLGWGRSFKHGTSGFKQREGA